MTYREETHTVECQAKRMIMAIENLRDEFESYSDDIAFRVALQDNAALTWADVLADPEQVGIEDMICYCHVKAQALAELVLGATEIHD